MSSKGILEPFQTRGLVLPNRLVKSATYENAATGRGEVTDFIVEWYRKMARGGVGLIITGHAYIEPAGKAGPRQIGVDSDRRINGLKKVTDAVHMEGGRIALQVSHAGRQTNPIITKRRTMGPSRVMDPLFPFIPKEMTSEDIERTADQFGRSAGRAREAGFDAVQVHGAHGYLLNQWLSPGVNKRKDKWGVNLEGRIQFPLHVVHAVRKAVGEDFPLLYKINAEDYAKTGLHPHEAADAASRLMEGGVDLMELSAGGASGNIFYMCRGDIPLDEVVFITPLSGLLKRGFSGMRERYRFFEAYNMNFAEIFQKSVKGPLMVVGGMRSRRTMEEALDRGTADLFAMARPLIHDPELPRRLERNEQRGSTCRNCNRCLARMFRLRPIGCAWERG